MIDWAKEFHEKAVLLVDMDTFEKYQKEALVVGVDAERGHKPDIPPTLYGPPPTYGGIPLAWCRLGSRITAWEMLDTVRKGMKP